MAQRRMFSKSVARTDHFLDMSQSVQNLYFHLGIEADDDGFVSPKMVMRMLGSTSDDLQVLVAKGFVIPFQSGVIVIRHWRENNYIQADRYKASIYPEREKLLIDKSGIYQHEDEYDPQNPDNEPLKRLDTKCIQDVRVGKVRLGKDTTEQSSEIVIVKDEEEKPSRPDRRTSDKLAVFRLFGEEKKPWWIHKHQRDDALALFDAYTIDQLKKAISIARANRDDQFCPKINTPSDLARRMESLLDYKERNRIE